MEPHDTRWIAKVQEAAMEVQVAAVETDRSVRKLYGALRALNVATSRPRPPRDPAPALALVREQIAA